MKPKEIRLLPREPLTPADQKVLFERFRKRLRSFFAVTAMLVLLVAIELGPNTQKVNDAIENPKLRWAIIAFAVVLGAAVFYGRVWIYRRDLRAGFKYVNRMIVIGKNPPAGKGHSIDLEDLEYHNLEVDAAAWERLQPGDRYGVGFAAYSKLALSREAASES